MRIEPRVGLTSGGLLRQRQIPNRHYNRGDSANIPLTIYSRDTTKNLVESAKESTAPAAGPNGGKAVFDNRRPGVK